MQLNAIKIFLCLFAAALVYAYGASIFTLAIHQSRTDIMITYLSGKMLNAHLPGYHYSQEYLIANHLKTTTIPNLSPPFSIILTALIARYFSYQSFFIAFTVSALLLNIWALTRLYQYFFPKRDTFHRLLLIAFILANLLYMPTFMNTTFGQVALLLNALVIFSYLSLEKKHYIRAGLFLAIAINIKIFFGIFLVYFLAKKQHLAFFSFLFSSIVLALMPLLIYGTSIYQGYWHSLNHIQWFSVNWNASWYGFFSRLLGETSHRFNSVLFFPKLSQFIYQIFFLAYTFLIYYFSRKNLNTPLTFAFTLSSMLLISPLGWNYYFPILITALLITITSAESNRYYTPLICLLLFSLFLSALPFPLDQDAKMTTTTLISRGNVFFISLVLFNTINLLQLLLPTENNRTPILTRKFKVFIFSICLFPSIIGVSGVITFLIKNNPIEKEVTTLATTSDLLPSNTD